MKKFKPWLVLLLVFFTGVGVGVFGTRLAVRKMVREAAANPDLMRERIEKQLTHELDLTPEQQRQISETLVASQERIRLLRSEFHPRFLEIFDEAEAQIGEALTPEQREKFREYLQKKKPYWRMKMPSRTQP
mgnify:FL=1